MKRNLPAKCSLILWGCLFAVSVLRSQTIEYCPFGPSFEQQHNSDSLYRKATEDRFRFLHHVNDNQITVQSVGPLVIPVVVHVMHQSSEAVGQGLNISYAQVLSQIDRLNADFDNDTVYTQLPSGQWSVSVGIQFCLAKIPMGPTAWPNANEPGVMRYNATSGVLDQIYDYGNQSTVTAMLAQTHPNSNFFPFSQYLNIWTVNKITDGGTANYGGYSPLPLLNAPFPLDGVVMNAHMFGDNTVNNNYFSLLSPQYNTGNILAHEVGHYLSLMHTFTGGCAGMSNSDCQTSGDFICDTPPNTNTSGSCNVGNTCAENISPYGNRPDMIENYMTWHDDNCINTFTYDQANVMRNYLIYLRPGLVEDTNLALTGVAGPGGCLPPMLSAAFTAPINFCVNQPTTFQAYGGPNFANHVYTWTFANATPSTSTAQNPTVTFTVSGAQLVTLTVTDTVNNQTVTSQQYVYASPCASLQSTMGNWYFGRQAGISFATGTGQVDNAAFVNNTIRSLEATVSISDSAGALIFYTNGDTIWDRNHQVAVSNLVFTTTQSKSQIIATPHPLHKNWYYLFHAPAYEDGPNLPLYFSVIADSNGTIIPITLNDTAARCIGQPGFSEQITAVPHCNGRDTWIITGGMFQPNNYNNTMIWTRRLFVFLVSPAGVTNPDGVSPYPSVFTFSTFPSTYPFFSEMKASSDGTQIAVAASDGAILVSFDPSTGVISNDRFIYSVSGWKYGLSFSPDGNSLYESDGNVIYGADLTVPNPVFSNTYTVSAAPWGLQIGPDSMLYIARGGASSMVDRFNNPNNLANPGYVSNAIALNLNYPLIRGGSGLPNFIEAVRPAPTPLAFTTQLTSCNSVSFNFPGCWHSGYTFDWDFGDNTTGSGQSATHTYALPGTYTVTLAVNIGTFAYTVTNTVVILNAAPQIAGPQVVCSGSIAQVNYTLPTGLTYFWNVTGGGNIISSNQTSSVIVSWSSSGTINCIVNNGPNCQYTVSLPVTVNQSPTADAGADTIYACINSSFYLGGAPTATGGTAPYSYQWLPLNSTTPANSSNPVSSLSAPSSFTVNVTDANGCVGSDVIYVEIDSTLIPPTVSMSPLPASCDNATSINLVGYASPVGGTFSGLGVTGNSFDPSLAIAPDTNTIYYLYTDPSNGCSTLDSTSAYVYNCCTVATGINTAHGQTSSTYGAQFNSTPTPVRINGTFYVNNTFFINAYTGTNTVYCAPNSTIIIKNGARLVIQAGSTLAPCGDMWNGIIIEPGGELEILTNGTLRGAKQAIVSKNGAKFTLDQAVLRDNYQNIIVEPHAGQGLHPGTIVRSRVIGTTLTLSPYAGVNTFSGMEITNVDSIYVGIATTTADENEFRGMDLGIITSQSNAYIRNNQFNSIATSQVFATPSCCALGNCGPNVNCNPAPKGTAIWATGNNVNIGGPSVAYQNRFTSCTRGVLAEDTINASVQNNKFMSIATSNTLIQSNCIEVRNCYMNSEVITDNIMYSCLNGIVFGFSNQTSAVIDRNDLDKMKGTSIQVTQTTECPVSIGFNTVNATATANGKYGIRVANAVVTNSTPYIEVHGNITKMVDKHIWVTNFPYIIVDSSNNMQFVNGVPSSTQYGVQVQNSHDALVDGNTVTKNGAVPTDTNYRKRLYGISMETNCYNTQVSNNGLFKVGTGVQYFNSNNYPSSISCNNFFNDMRGVLFTNTYIGDQGAPISVSNPNGIAQDNQWTITGSQTTVYKTIWMVNSPTNDWYYRSNTSTYNPPAIQQWPAGFFGFYGPLSNAPSSCVQPCATCRTQADLAALAEGEVPNDSTGDASKFITDQSIYAQLRRNDSLMAMGTEYDTVLVNFFREKAIENVGYINEAYTLASAGNVNGAAAAKDGIVPSGNPDMNHKIVIEIYLRSWAIGQLEFTREDSAALYGIAYQNVMDGGTAVYDARVMLDLDIDDVHSGSGARLAADTAQSTAVGYLYPNPTCGNAIYEIALNENESGYIIITDVFGRPLIQEPLRPGFNQIELNMSTLPSGIYLYKAIVADEILQAGKVVVDK